MPGIQNYNFPQAGNKAWKAPVDTLSSLPTLNNQEGDVRVVLDTQIPYVWDGNSWEPMNSAATLEGLFISQIYTVGKSGAVNFNTIADAMAAITDASISKQYCIQIFPGVYLEQVVLKPYVHLQGIGTGVGLVQVISEDTPLTGTLQNDTLSACSGIQFICTPSVAGKAAIDVTGSIGFLDCFFVSQTAEDVEFSGVKLRPQSGGATAMSACSLAIVSTKTNSTNHIASIIIDGPGQCFIANSSVRATVNMTSGASFCGFQVSAQATGEIFVNQTGLTFLNESTNATGSSVRGACIHSASNFERVFTQADWRFSSNGGGDFDGAWLDSDGQEAEVVFSGMTFSSEGFDANNTYLTNTAVGDVQRLWLNSSNKDLGKRGEGLAIITPYDDAKSGFIQWAGSGNYWSYSPISKEFTLLRKCSGVVRGSPVIIPAGQSTTLSADYVTQYVYGDSQGILRSTPTVNEDLYNNFTVLFEVLSDGTDYVVTKENHPLKFTSAVSSAWHRLFGVLLEGRGAVISVLSGANRTIGITGEDTLTDHGLDTTIPDSAGNAVPWFVTYDGANGPELVSAATSLPGQFNNGNLLSNTNQVVVFRLAATKDNLNSTAAQYIARAHTTTFSNVSQARTACNANNIALFQEPVRGLEIAQLGFAIISGDGAGGGTLNEVIVSRQTFAANFNAAAAAAAASSVNTNTSNFNGILGVGDTTVQLALDTLDNFVIAPNFRAPVLTTTARNALTPVEGTLVADSTDNKLYIYLGATWRALN